MRTYVIVEQIKADTFYDVAYVRVGVPEDNGVLLKIPVPKELNSDWIDSILTKEIKKIVKYITKQGGK